MTHYCPVCQSEFRDNISVCPDDGATLSTNPPRVDQHPIIDFYRAANEIEATRIQSLLSEAGIQSNLLRSQVAQLPMVNDALIISLHHDEKSEAKRILEQAIRDGILPDTGAFI